MENDVENKLKLLRKSFPGVFEKELEEDIAEKSIYKVFERGSVMIDIDDELQYIPLILEGVVKIVRRDHKNDEILMYFLEKGDTCAISFINCLNRSKSIFKGTVERETKALLLPVYQIEEWMINYRSWRQFIVDSYHHRLLEMVDAVDSLAFLKLDNRLIKYLKHQSEVLNTKKLLIKHQDIASDLHTSRVVVSRLLKKIEKEGHIRLGRNKIFLIDI